MTVWGFLTVAVICTTIYLLNGHPGDEVATIIRAWRGKKE